MKNIPNAYDYVMSMYRSTDNLRPGMTAIFKQENYHIATDSYTVIYVDSSASGLQYRPNEKSPDALSLLKKFTFDKTETIQTEQLLQQYFNTNLEWDKKLADCVDCEGTGSTECDCCGHENECDECAGSGESHEAKPFAIPVLKGDSIHMFYKKFSSQFIHRVIQTAYFLQAPSIIVKYQDGERNPCLFEIKEASIIVMPTL